MNSATIRLPQGILFPEEMLVCHRFGGVIFSFASPHLLRSSPQFANRFVTKHKETQAFAGFWRVLFLVIPKGFTAKITSFFGL